MNEYKVTLKAARVNAGYTLEGLSAELGVHKTTLLKWEKGKTPIPAFMLKRICEICKAPEDAILLPGD